MSLDLKWPRPLSHRPGAAERLDGLDVYYDFEWLDHFVDGRAQFRNGQALARFVRQACPEGKTPALLLTTDETAREGFEETPTHSVCVLHLPSYREAEANPFLAYLGAKLGDGIARMGPLGPDVAERAAAGAAVLQSPIDIGQIAAWVEEDPARLKQLHKLAGGGEQAELGDVLNTLAGLGEDLEPELVASIGALFGAEAKREQRVQLLRAIAADSEGRYLTGEVLLGELPQRISEAREALAAYRELLENPDSTETDLQEFIEGRLWLLGLEYVKFRARRPLIRGTADFILERVDGFHDLLELKDPQDPIIIAPDAVDGMPPSASKYALSPALAKALAQAHVYRYTLTTDDRANEQAFGLRDTRDPRLIIVVGRASSLPAHRLHVLREMNRSLHRVEVVPYDALVARAESALDNVQRYLIAGGEAEPPDKA